MKLIYTSFILFFILSCSDSNTETSTQKKYLNEVFKIVDNNSLYKDSVDLQDIKRTAYAKLKDTDSIENCYPIIKLILKDLKDNHSFFMSKEQVDRWKTTSKTGHDNELITFNGKLINKEIGYIYLKGFSSGDSISIQRYADSLQKLIENIDKQNLKGWVLDLRENTGGNCWPMLAGLGPLLGNGICGYFIDNNQTKSSWFYRDGIAGIDTTTIVKVSTQPYKLLNTLNPIAVLTGSQTASSGEVVVTAFHNKINAKSFGESTAGFSTGNANFELSDGSIIFLTTSIYADRLGNLFGKKINPDEIIEFSYESIGQSNDMVVKRAMDWIYENE